MKPNLTRFLRRPLLGVFASILVYGAVYADDAASSGDFGVKAQGFMSLVGGRVLSGTKQGPLVEFPNVRPDHSCPCYIADFANAGVYGKDYSFKPESHIGGQLDVTFSDQFSITAQAIIRGEQPKPDLQWLYGDYKFDGHWNLHAGRQRIPLYYYSDFQDIGLSYPWVSPPPEVYGWEATNYNGVSLRYHGLIDDVSVNASVYGGEETVRDDQFTKIIFSDPFKVKWKNIIGGNVELSRDFWTVRLNLIHSNITWEDKAATNPYGLGQTASLHAFGIATNLDFDTWFVQGEMYEQIRNQYLPGYGFSEVSPVGSLGVGYRWGKFTPYLNYARFWDHYVYSQPQPNGPQFIFPNAGWGATLRYDIDPSSAFKVQYDSYTDRAPVPPETLFSGDAKVFRISYDRVF